jgi:hypothetical protein
MLQLLLSHVPDVYKKQGFIFGSLAYATPFWNLRNQTFSLLSYNMQQYFTSLHRKCEWLWNCRASINLVLALIDSIWSHSLLHM